MPHVELPLPLPDYFAHAETESTRDARRFTITFPYFFGERIDRMQWWWTIGFAQQKIVGDAGVLALRRQAVERFCRHIENWLESTGQKVSGDGPIPLVAAMPLPAPVPAPAPMPAPTPAADPVPESVSNVVPFDKGRAASG